MADTKNFLDYNGLSIFWGKVKKVIEDNELVTASALTDLDNRVKALFNGESENSIIVAGSGEGSGIMKGAENSATGKNSLAIGQNNEAISENSVAMGNNAIAGLKGWYYGSINKINDNTIDVYISDSQRGVLNYPTWGGTTTLSTLNPYEVLGPGVVVSLINDVKYDNKFEVIDGEAGRIRLRTVSGNLPFSSIAIELVLDPEDYSIYCLSMPTAGVVDVSLSSIAEGRSTKALGACSHAEGYNTNASGKYSHVEGRDTEALYIAHAEGSQTKALGNASHAEGTSTQALNSNSHAEGFETEVKGYAGHAEGKGTKVLSDYGHSEGELTEVSVNSNSAHAEGIRTKASNTAAHAEGRNTIASGVYSHAEGYNDDNNEDYGAFGAISHTEGYATVTTSTANSGHAEGRFTTVSGMGAHAEGISNTASGEATHVEGKYTKATGYAAHAEGYGESLEKPNLAQGDYSHVEGEKTQTLGMAAHAEGGSSIAKGNFSHSEGRFTRAHALCSHAEGFSVEGKEDSYGAFGPISHVEGYANITTSAANSAHAEGRLNTASGMAAHVEGISNIASGEASHAEGHSVTASGFYSHAEGYDTIAFSSYSHAEGDRTTASGSPAHAEGSQTKALGNASHAEGYHTKSSGHASHAEGAFTDAEGEYSHAEGYRTTASGDFSHAEGKYNKSNDNTIHSVGIGTSDTDRKNAHEIMSDGKHYIYGVGEYDGTNPDSSEDVASAIKNLIEITYTELVNLRNTSKLTSGRLYRITDYITTTVQTNTQSAGHPFDVIVLALSEDELSEQAWACHSERDTDTYFANSDLNAWELKYCLDNDTARFAWVNASNGKGVIYYMKDEFNNECPYDFKNIQFARWQLSNPVGYRNDFDEDNWEDNWILESTPFDSLKTGFYGLNGSEDVFYYIYNGDYDRYKVEYTISDEPTYCYTFGNGTDYSISGSDYGNVIKEYKSSNKIQLNNIVFLGNSCYSNSFGDGCYSNSFGEYCDSNSFGDECNSNSFGDECNSNSFGNECYNNSLGRSCYSNSFGNSCSSNSFGNNCYQNSFGDGCYSNSFGNNCYQNSFGDGCYSNSFGDSCKSNSFGNNCSTNTFGESKDNPKSYYRYIIFDNGNRYINLNCTSTTSSSKYYQNVRIGLGVNNKSTYKTISDSNVGQTYETLYKPANSQTITI